MRLRDEIADLLAQEHLAAVYGPKMGGVSAIGSEDDERAADRIITLLREGPWFDEAVERMLADWEIACSACVVEGTEFVLDVPRLLARLLLAALGEDR